MGNPAHGWPSYVAKAALGLVPVAVKVATRVALGTAEGAGISVSWAGWVKVGSGLLSGMGKTHPANKAEVIRTT